MKSNIQVRTSSDEVTIYEGNIQLCFLKGPFARAAAVEFIKAFRADALKPTELEQYLTSEV